MKANKKVKQTTIYIPLEKKKFIINNIPDDATLSGYMVQATLDKIALDNGNVI